MTEDSVVCCPSVLQDHDVRAWLSRLVRVRKSPRVGIDFSRVSFAQPYGTLLLAAALRSFVEARKLDGLETFAQGLNAEARAQSYLSHIGFFRFVGLPRGSEVDEAKGSGSYVPITVLSRSDYQDEVLDHDRIERKAVTLAEVLAPDEDSVGGLSYCLREVVRNVFEHSGAPSCCVSAQRYSDKVEAAIVDNGIGILSSFLSLSPAITAEDALDQALLPGVSRVPPWESVGPWGNSGYGLYVLSELGRSLGSFELASSGRYVSVRRDATLRGEVPFYGTAVKLRFSFARSEYFPNVIEQIVRTGEQLAQARLGHPRPASARSRMASGGGFQ